jgi:hypothetical protein
VFGVLRVYKGNECSVLKDTILRDINEDITSQPATFTL